MSLGRCAQCRGFVNASDVECPNCGATQQPQRRGALAGVTRAAAAAGAAMTLMACYGGPPPPSQPLYTPCGPEGAEYQCAEGECRESQFQRGTQLCTVSCTTTGAACPVGRDGRAGVCVISNGPGQCFQRCTTQSDCDPYGMTCRLNGSDSVCVPDWPGDIVPYGACRGFGFGPCGMGSTCEPTSLTSTGAPVGSATVANHCTRECTSDAQCAYQGVCAAGQCYLACDPMSTDAGDPCAGAPGPGAFGCVPTPDGTRNVCVPVP